MEQSKFKELKDAVWHIEKSGFKHSINIKADKLNKLLYYIKRVVNHVKTSLCLVLCNYIKFCALTILKFICVKVKKLC